MRDPATESGHPESGSVDQAMPGIRFAAPAAPPVVLTLAIVTVSTRILCCEVIFPRSTLV